LANFTKEAPLLNNSAIIGKSTNNANSNNTNYTNGMSAIITGRSGTYNISNVRIYNYPTGSLMLQTCRYCDNLGMYTNLGTEVFVQQLTMDQVNGQILFMIGMKRDVVYDVDASLSLTFGGGNTRTSGAIIQPFTHIAGSQQSACLSSTSPTSWDNTIMCDQTVTVRRVIITNLGDSRLFKAQ
jgi:hypothetical protein